MELTVNPSAGVAPADWWCSTHAQPSWVCQQAGVVDPDVCQWWRRKGDLDEVKQPIKSLSELARTTAWDIDAWEDAWRFLQSEFPLEQQAAVWDALLQLAPVQRPDRLVRAIRSTASQPLCNSRSSDQPLGFYCSLPQDHDPPHLARGIDGQVYRTWA